MDTRAARGEDMRRAMIALLATCLLGATASAVLAQSPAPFGLGGRVEVPEAGYALTLPDGWAYLRPAMEDAGSLAAFIEAELQDPDLAARLVVLATEMRPDDIMLLGVAHAARRSGRGGARERVLAARGQIARRRTTHRRIRFVVRRSAATHFIHNGSPPIAPQTTPTETRPCPNAPPSSAPTVWRGECRHRPPN